MVSVYIFLFFNFLCSKFFKVFNHKNLINNNVFTLRNEENIVNMCFFIIKQKVEQKT